MTEGKAGGPTYALLSFSEEHLADVRRTEQRLQDAGVSTVLDPWVVTQTGDSHPRTERSIAETDVLVPCLTTAGDETGWLGPAWEKARLEPAIDASLPIIPVRVGPCAVPGMIAHLTFADLVYRDANLETRKLLGAIKSATGDDSITVPDFERSEADADDVVPPAVQITLSGPIVDALGGDSDLANWQADRLDYLRRGIYWELGLVLPTPVVVRDGQLRGMQAQVALHGVTEALIDVPEDRVFVDAKLAEATTVDQGAVPAVTPEHRGPAAWIRADKREEAVAAGWRTLDVGDYLLAELASLFRRKAATLLDTRLTAQLVRRIEPHYPRLVRETVPHPIHILLLTGILRRLLAEGISIRDLRRILMILGDWALREHEPSVLAEYVRAGLKRQITHLVAGRNRVLHALLVDPQIEARIAKKRKSMATASYVELDADEARHLIERIAEPMHVFLKSGYQLPVVLTVLGIRAPLRRLIALSLPTVRVVSYEELLPDVNIQPIGRITDGPFSWRRGVTEMNELELED